jgi:hypothetical protein
MADKDDKKAADASAEVGKAVAEAEKQGFIGEEVDPTPNERYSQESDNWATPESDPDEAEKVGSRKFAALKKGAK